MKRIMLATDGSALAGEALEFALELCQDTGASLDVLSVTVPVVASHGAGVPVIAVEEPAQTDRITREAVERARAAGISAEALTAQGQPATEIARVAAERSVDLIVTGSRGLGMIRGALLGSVSGALIRSGGDIPVTVVKAHAAPGENESMRRRKALAGGIEQLLDEAETDAAWRPFPLRSLVRHEVAVACAGPLAEIRAALVNASATIESDALDELHTFMTDGVTSPLFAPDVGAAAGAAGHLRDAILGTSPA